MIQVKMQNIDDRSKSIIKFKQEPKYLSMCNTMLENGYSYENTKNLLRHWNCLGEDQVVCETIALALFEMSVLSETSASHINSLGDIIVEGIVPKLRDGGQMRNYVKHRIARFKTRLHTKFNTNVDNMKTSNSDTIAKFNQAISSVTKAATGVAPTAQPKQDVNPKNEEAAIKVYERLDKALSEMVVCDTILNNQKKLNSRFNFNKLIEESADIEDCIDILCECIDTYRMGIKHKYNVALQNIPYSLHKSGIKYDMKDIVEGVTDYFLFNSDSPDIPVMKKVLEHNMTFLYEKKDVEGLDYMFKDIAKLDIKFDDTMVLLHEVDAEKVVNTLKQSKDKIEDMINDFKKSAEKTPDKLKALIRRIYTQPADQIIDEYPDILSLIRKSVLFCSLGSLHPLLGIVGLCVDFAITLHFSRKQLDKYIEKQEKEIEKVNKKIDKAKNDEQKKKLEEYKETLKKGLEKLRDHRNKLYTEEEAEKLRDRDMDKDMELDRSGDDDIDFDFNFDEAVDLIYTLGNMMEDYNNMLNRENNIVNLKESLIDFSTIDAQNTIDFFDITLRDGSSYKDFYNDALMETVIKANNKKDPYTPVNNILYGEKAKMAEVSAYNNARDIDYSIIENANTIQRLKYSVGLMNNINTAYKAINDISESVINTQHGVVLTEADIKATLQLASINLKNAIKNLSDKEKIASRNLDASVNTFSRGVERALKNDNREAVLRGSMIPSASKTVKTAILLGTAWAVQPALAVIGALGAFALSKNIQAKERQMILDEIEIELEMNEKYLRTAEDNNDMKAMRELLKIQRDLKRQHQRIKYHMRVYHNQTVGTGASANPDSED